MNPIAREEMYNEERSMTRWKQAPKAAGAKEETPTRRGRKGKTRF